MLASSLVRMGKQEDVEHLAAIHLAAMSDGLLGKLGKNFLQNIFYPTCLQSTDSLLFVYEEAGKISSFVIYARNSRSLTQQLLAHKFALLVAMVKNIIRKPSLIRDALLFLKGFKIELLPDYQNIIDTMPELYLIATDPTNQNKGQGSKLVKESLLLLAEKFSKECCMVKTMSNDANRFYIKHGFKPIGTEYRGKQKYSILYQEIKKDSD